MPASAGPASPGADNGEGRGIGLTTSAGNGTAIRRKIGGAAASRTERGPARNQTVPVNTITSDTRVTNRSAPRTATRYRSRPDTSTLSPGPKGETGSNASDSAWRRRHKTTNATPARTTPYDASGLDTHSVTSPMTVPV